MVKLYTIHQFILNKTKTCNEEYSKHDKKDSIVAEGKGNTTFYYVFHSRVTLFFADNSLTQCRITMKFLHNFF